MPTWKNDPKNWKVYLVECSDGTYYTGIAKDVVQRINVHNSGKGAKYTRGRLPVKLIIASPCLTESRARMLESAVKSYPRHKKALYIAKWWRYRTK